MIGVTEFWVYFSAQPLMWIVVTLAVYAGAYKLHAMSAKSPLLHPVLISMTVLIALLWLTETQYQTYFSGAQFIHFLLGPATVAIAIPLFDHFAKIRTLWLPILVACIVGAFAAASIAVLVAYVFDASPETLLSIAPKSVTSPIALGISEKIGGFPELSAALCLVTGILGSLLVPNVLRIMRVEDEETRGFVLGLTSHGFGTALALEAGALAGAFAGLAMGLTGLITAIMLPLLAALF
jgi:predicted murein hydrolase (TIGR00659 family)